MRQLHISFFQIIKSWIEDTRGNTTGPLGQRKAEQVLESGLHMGGRKWTASIN
jgi:hypothetical protein